MIHTFKLEPKYEPGNDYATLGTIPAGRILKSEPIFEGSKIYWLIVVDDAPERSEPREIYSGQRSQ